MPLLPHTRQGVRRIERGPAWATVPRKNWFCRMGSPSSRGMWGGRRSTLCCSPQRWRMRTRLRSSVGVSPELASDPPNTHRLARPARRPSTVLPAVFRHSALLVVRERPHHQAAQRHQRHRRYAQHAHGHLFPAAPQQRELPRPPGDQIRRCASKAVLPPRDIRIPADSSPSPWHATQFPEALPMDDANQLMSHQGACASECVYRPCRRTCLRALALVWGALARGFCAETRCESRSSHDAG